MPVSLRKLAVKADGISWPTARATSVTVISGRASNALRIIVAVAGFRANYVAVAILSLALVSKWQRPRRLCNQRHPSALARKRRVNDPPGRDTHTTSSIRQMRLPAGDEQTFEVGEREGR